MNYKSEPGNERSLFSNWVNSLFFDKDGVLWVGTSKGVNVYDQRRDDFIRRHDLPLLNIYRIAQDRHGNMLFGSHNLYVERAKGTPKVLEFFPDDNRPNSISHGLVNCIFIDSKNNVWIGTQHGLNLFNVEMGIFKRIYEMPGDERSLLGNQIHSIAEDSLHRLWVGTSKGLNMLDLDQNEITFKRFAHQKNDVTSLSGGTVLSIYCDSQSRLWVGTQNGGVNLLHEDGNGCFWFQRFATPIDNLSPTTIAYQSIQTIFEDRQGNLWFGTYAAGVCVSYAAEKRFVKVSTAVNQGASLSNNHVNTFLEDGSAVWIGTEWGLNRYDTITGRSEKFIFREGEPHGLLSNSIWALAKDRRGRMWIGTWGGGLSYYDLKGGRFVNLMDEAVRQHVNCQNVFSILVDDDDNLWLGTMGGGLVHYDVAKNRFTAYELSNSHIATNYVEAVVPWSDDVLLLANINGISVFRKSDRQFSPLLLPESMQIDLRGVYVYCMLKDRTGCLWMGTEVGLFVLNSDWSQGFRYTVADGLPNNSVKSIEEDDEGYLWLGTNNGLSRVDAGCGDTRCRFTNYTVGDGLQGKEFNRRSVMKTSRGGLYFGGIHGMNRFMPSDIRSNPYVPPVVITDLFFHHEPVLVGGEGSPLMAQMSLTDTVVLQSNQNHFGFGFAALNFVSSGHNQFAYRLEGLDQQWNEVGEHREVNYTNVSPGEYRFQVRAANNDGLWNDTPASVHVIVLPPWWRTNVAYAIYGLMVLLLIYLFRRYSLIEANRKHELIVDQFNHMKDKEVSQAKFDFFTHLSHEIRTPLSLIKAPIDDLVHDERVAPEVKERVMPAYRNTRRLVMLIDQLLNFRKVEEGQERLNASYVNVIDMVGQVVEAFMYKSSGKSGRIVLDANEAELHAWLDADKMMIVLYNLLSNALKYSGDDNMVTVSVGREGDVKGRFEGMQSKDAARHWERVVIRVADKGIGIPAEVLPLVFNPYYRGDHHMHREMAKGTGIGLSLAKKYVELHAGVISVQSELGKGSIFEVNFPAEANRPEGAQAFLKTNTPVEFVFGGDFTPGVTDIYSSHTSATGRSLVLLIEDHPELLDYLCQQLMAYYQVVAVGTGEEGLQKARELNPDLVVTDVMLPGMDGFALTQALKGDILTSHIPIVMLTAKGYDEHHLQGVQSGADAYLTKPFSMPILFSYIRNILESGERLKSKYRQKLVVEPSGMSVNHVDQEFLSKLLAVMKDQMGNPEFDVQELCDEMHVSYRTMARKIKALTDLTATEFIRSLRLKHAAGLLANGALNVSEVSQLSGFNDPAYFSRCFQKEFGVSPSNYGTNSPLAGMSK
ncbi:hybrid sensor histidine kinase/response regulator transcription factor [Breznakibacter xylanolyticus]|uniref:hybrid sensor histidine kinase/response regulator transcription factor n=1 Tax=Breznakibacter xylanolyticus TaxID=990 RepID=UPI0021CFC744|nr:hybrid sensor histidine kinase/response regulator transcription factor [Breznakibacter xylanolyticus]